MNDNVGEMPLDIFSDYISDILGEEWNWQYLILAINETDDGCGQQGNGDGVVYDYHRMNNLAYGYGYISGDGFGYGLVSGAGFELDFNYIQGATGIGDGYNHPGCG
jgi:hypothetical protein